LLNASNALQASSGPLVIAVSNALALARTLVAEAGSTGFKAVYLTDNFSKACSPAENNGYPIITARGKGESVSKRNCGPPSYTDVDTSSLFAAASPSGYWK